MSTTTDFPTDPMSQRMQDIVKQEAFGNVPPDVAAGLRARPREWLACLTAMTKEIDYQLGERRLTDATAAEWEEYRLWRNKANRVKSKLDIRIVEAKELIRKANIERTEQVANRKYHTLRQAIIDHRTALQTDDYEATEADLALWAVLDSTEASAEAAA